MHRSSCLKATRVKRLPFDRSGLRRCDFGLVGYGSSAIPTQPSDPTIHAHTDQEGMLDAEEDGSRPSDHGEEEGEDEEEMRKRHNKETRVSLGVHVGSINHMHHAAVWWWWGEGSA